MLRYFFPAQKKTENNDKFIQTIPFHRLPFEVQLFIFSMLIEPIDLIHVSHVCKLWKLLTENNAMLWRQFINNDSRKITPCKEAFFKHFVKVEFKSQALSAMQVLTLDYNQISVYLLGNKDSNTNQIYNLPVTNSMATYPMYDLYNPTRPEFRTITLDDGKLIQLNQTNNDHLKSLKNDLMIPNIALISITKKNDIHFYQNLIAESKNPNILTIFVAKQPLLATISKQVSHAELNIIELAATDNLESFCQKIRKKIQEIAASEKPQARFCHIV